MSEELLINVSPVESRVAVLNNGVVSEVYIERHNKLGLVGNIYLGTVVRVLPGMQAAFIDIGQSRTAFLHVNDMQRLPRPAPTLTALPDIQGESNHVPTVLSSLTVTSAHKSESTTTNDESAVVTEDLDNTNIATKHAIKNTALKQPNTENVSHSSANAHPVQNSENLPPSSYSGNPIENNIDSVISNSDNNEQSKRLDSGLGEKQSALADEASNLDSEMPSAVGNAITQADTASSYNTNKNYNKYTKSQTREPQRDELIQYRLQQGQKILVQVTKDQLGSKGARLTTNISLPSRYLVYLPSSEHIGISQRIDNEEERTRLKTELASLMQTVNLQGGVIARTAAERVPVAKLEEDIYYLLQLWRTIQARKKEFALSNQPAVMIYQELSLPLRAIRDLVHPDTTKITVDNDEMYERLKQFAKEFVPSIEPRIAYYNNDQPLFDIHRVEEDLKDALKRRVDLKSGGYLVIDQTEAMTTIDVNTGSYVGARSLEDTVYKTNLEATHAIAHQLRLRNLGGIIILDFIDMSEQEHKDDVLQSLQTKLAQDYAKTKITQVSELGLVEMTRKRTRESLEQQLCEPCQTCQGKGFIKTAETVCFEIFREIMRCARTYDSPKKFTVVAHAAVIDLLLSSEADTVADLEYLVGRVITFEVEDLYTQEQYDIVLD